MALDAGLATVVAGIVAGVVGMSSALLSWLTLRAQQKQQQEENERSRRHAVALSAFSKVLISIETAWEILSEMQQSNTLSEELTQRYILTLVWLPNDLRSKMLILLREFTKGSESYPSIIEEVQKELISYARTLTSNGEI